MATPEPLSSYLQHLPAIFHETAAEEAQADLPHFLGRFLLAFEKLLSGLGDPQHPGVEERLDRIHQLFDPQTTPEDFLPWLAGWVALSLRDDWQTEAKRRFIGYAVALYRLRGTRQGLKLALATYSGFAPDSIDITERHDPLVVGVHSTVGVDTIIGGAPPYSFWVTMNVPANWRPAPGESATRQQAIVRAIIDQEKPAHTVYNLRFNSPTIIVGVRSTVGVDTILGTGS
jgi:phage tail-like protein